MRNIFIGLILILIDLNINSGASTLNLVPDFIGYAFVLKGVIELCKFNGNMTSAITWGKVMIAIAVVEFGVDVFGLSEPLYFLGIGLSGVSIACHFYLFYLIIKGLKEIQMMVNYDLYAENLMTWWKVNAIVTGVCYVGGSIIGGLFALGAVVVGILFVVQVYKSVKQWEMRFGM